MLVCVGITDKKAVFRYLKKIHAKVEFSKWVLTEFDNWKKDLEEKNIGQLCWHDDLEKQYGLVLMLRPYFDAWDYWQVLIHELNHVVQFLAKKKGFQDEPENQAYLQEHLFRSIRRKLQGTDKIT